MAPTATTITVVPTSEQRRPFRQWAGPRGVATLPGNGFAVPVDMIREVPEELMLGAKVNGVVYFPQAGQVRHDAPPLEPEGGELPEGEWIPLEGELQVGAGPLVTSAWSQPHADDIATTGAPDPDDSP
jgi:hypothetical protein